MKARNELWLLSFLAFGVNYMLRININIAIVDMVTSNKNPPKLLVLADGVDEYENGSQPIEFGTAKPPTKTQIHWNEYEQNLVLSAYFWTHWILQVPGGLLAHYFGTKHTIGFVNLSCALLTFFIPLAASYGFYAIFVLRALQGCIASACWPAMPSMVAKWIPPKERSTFVSSYLGSSVGAAFTYFLCGIVIELFGWQYAFYVTGILGILWWIAWVYRVYDSPQKHPWISKEEREYIEGSLTNTSNRKKLPIPWKDILSSRAVLINGIAQWGVNGASFALLTHMPMYLNYIHGLPIKGTGLWSGIPHLTKWIVAVCFGLVAEYQNCLSITNIRKLATFLSTIAVALILYILVFFECNTILAVTLLLLANTLQGTASAGPLASLIDMSPNFAGILQGLIGTVGTAPGFLYPLLVGYLTQNNQTSAQWQKFFFIVSTATLICGVVYMLFGTSKIQSWNAEKGVEKEMDTLRQKGQEYSVKVKCEKKTAK